MTTNRKITSMVVMFAMMIAAAAVAAPGGFGWRGSRGWSSAGRYDRLFDAKTMTTINGEIMSLARFTPMKGMTAGVHMKVKTAAETLDVHLGPAWYLESQEADLKAGDKVEVKGSRITYEKKPAIIAVTIKRGDDVLVLRDTDGFPRWAGWRRGASPRS